MGSQETIIELVRRQGPLLPAKVAKALNTNLLLASAQLSELVDSKKLKFSNVKVGGSPVYYLEGQEEKLQNFSENLNDKDRDAFELLKSKKVLMDERLDPLMRVAMRSIKDFAIPLQVTYSNQKLMFWKWYLLDNKEAENFIAGYLEPVEKRETHEKKKDDLPADHQAAQKAKDEQKKITEEKKRVEDERKKLEHHRKIEQEKLRLEREKMLLEDEKKRVAEQKKLEDERKRIEEERKKLHEEKRKLEEAMKAEKASIENLEVHKPSQKKLEEPKSEQPEAEQQTEQMQDEFFDQLDAFFREKKIEVVEREVIKKKLEIDFILRIPSVVGTLEYYCKAKNKKKINEGDLSAAFVQGQLKKLPVLMLLTGEITKKAQELLNTELNKGLIVNKI